ncbi:hypothetical protein CAI16_01815 [Virgibacillus dokdonensis]|uniref:Heptaprenyl diphosphate synthase n=2 Tax=Virgibacillus TaxID=84406 RepID=A0A1M5LH16_9BACI|nr:MULTISPECIES: heptaprenyl diphosphate synthase component 1 [Virgibacillus]RFA37240.1 hypothetical protein CAI16_01815 [Virgibacillus dokdonensis]SHG64341.1 heptaprenyl diphosphate synthase [Virgibacillus chiguensis]
MNRSAKDIYYVKAEIEKKIKHSYLEKYIDKPAIDEEKLFLLMEMMNHSSLPESHKQRYIVTTMLVQMALDTHDKVPSLTSPNENEDVKLQKQLHVLAGDYYSGLYYLVLAEISDFEFIQLLASTIKEINEYKMKLYYNEIDSLQDYMLIRNIIDTHLLVQVASFLNISMMGKIVEKWLLVIKLINDIEHFNARKMQVHSWVKSFFDKSELSKQLTALLQQLEDEVHKLSSIYSSLSNYLETEITSIKKAYISTMGEEG